MLRFAVAGVVVVIAPWWLYFDRSVHDPLTSLLWGYGHFILAGAAAVGVDHLTEHAELSGTRAAYTIAIPVALYLFFVWLLHIRPYESG